MIKSAKKDFYKRIWALIFALLTIFSSLLLVGCKKEQDEISYEIKFDFLGSGPEGKDFYAYLTEEDNTYEATIEMFPYYICEATLYVDLYNSNSGGTRVYKAPLSQLWKNFTMACTSYELYRDGQFVKDVGFCLDNIHLTREQLAGGAFMLARELGQHRIRFDIPAMEQYGTEAITFEITVNVVEDPRPKSAEISLTVDSYHPVEPDSVVNGTDFYILDEHPIFRVTDTETGEAVSSTNGSVHSRYRKLDESYYSNRIEFKMEKGNLYLCEAYYIYDSVYKSSVYKCIIWYR